MKLAEILKGGEGYVRGNSKVGDKLQVDHLSEAELSNLVKAKRIKLVDFEAAEEAADNAAELKDLTKKVADLEKANKDLEKANKDLVKKVADLEKAAETKKS